MYGNPNYQPWFGPPYQPQQQNQSPVQQITDWIRGLEELKKSMKEEKKPDDKKKSSDVSVISMMLFMVLISPITAPLTYKFFGMTLGLIR